MGVADASDAPAIPPEPPPPTLVETINEVNTFDLYLDEGPYLIRRCHPMPHSADVSPPNDRRDTTSAKCIRPVQSDPTAESNSDCKSKSDMDGECPPPSMNPGNGSSSSESSDDNSNNTDGPPPILHNFQTDDESSSDDSTDDEASVERDHFRSILRYVSPSCPLRALHPRRIFPPCSA